MNNILQLCKIFNCEINSLVNDNIIDLDSLGEEVKMSVVKFKEDKQKKNFDREYYCYRNITEKIT